MIVPAELVSVASSRSVKRRNNAFDQADLTDSIEEQHQQIEEISSNELEKLCDQLMKHREKITNPQEIKEFEGEFKCLLSISLLIYLNFI